MSEGGILGFLRYGESGNNVKAQIAKLKQQFQDNQQLARKHALKYNELLSFANVMSEGYLASMQVVIDVSSLLGAYKDLLDEITKGVSEFDSIFKSGLNQSDIEKLKNLTENNLHQIKNVFSVEYDKLYKLIAAASDNNPKYISDLERVKSAVIQVDNKAPALQAALQNGGLKPKPKKKVRSSKKPKA